MARRLLPPPPSLPDDLVPIPGFPGANAYAHGPIDEGQARSALWHAAGSITRAARFLQVSPARLMNLVAKTPYLREERDKAAELLVDAAEDVILDLLEDDERKEEIARFVLDRRGSSRGWGSTVKAPATNISFGSPGQNGQAMIAFKWQSDDE